MQLLEFRNRGRHPPQWITPAVLLGTVTFTPMLLTSSRAVALLIVVLLGFDRSSDATIPVLPQRAPADYCISYTSACADRIST